VIVEVTKFRKRRVSANASKSSAGAARFIPTSRRSPI